MTAEQAALHYAALLLEAEIPAFDISHERAPKLVREALTVGLDAAAVLVEMRRLANVLRQEAEAPEAPSITISGSALRAGLQGFFGGIALQRGMSLAKEMATIRDARPCPKCKAPIGTYCLNDEGKLTIHLERRAPEQPSEPPSYPEAASRLYFPTAIVLPGESTKIFVEVDCDMPINSSTLRIDETIAEDFLVADLLIDGKSCFPPPCQAHGIRGLSASVFSARSMGGGVHAGNVQRGQIIEIHAKNQGKIPHTLTCWLRRPKR